MGNICTKKCHKIEKKNISSPIDIKYQSALINWKSETPTYKYYWCPILEKDNDIENRDYFNLYSSCGGIEKYDFLFETDALEYQKRHHRIRKIHNKFEKECAGFSRLAAILSCTYPYPENDVIVTYKFKSYVFRKKDIEALMIIAAQNTVNKGITVLFGDYNKNTLDDINEPYPSYLISMLELISKLDDPFIMDIERDGVIWNYAFDKILVTEHKFCPIEHSPPSKNGLTKYYNFKIESTANPENNLNLWGYINSTLVPIAGSFHKKMTEGWITKINPHLIWKPHPKKCLWEGPCVINPHIDAEIVFRIYKQSFCKNSSINRLIIL